MKCPLQRQRRQQASRKGIQHRNETAEWSSVDSWQVMGTHGGKNLGQHRRQGTENGIKRERNCRLAPVKLSEGVWIWVTMKWWFGVSDNCNVLWVKSYHWALKEIKKWIGCYTVRSKVVIKDKHKCFSEYKDVTLSIKLIKLLTIYTICTVNVIKRVLLELLFLYAF